MAKLTRYVRDELYRNDEVYRADEVDAEINNIALQYEIAQCKLQRDLDAAQTALLDAESEMAGCYDYDQSVWDEWKQRHAQALDEARKDDDGE